MSIVPITTRTYDVCLWPVDPACFTEDWNGLAEEVQERSLALASATLHRLTGYRVGGCPVTVRPCKKSCAQEFGDFYYGAYGPAWSPHIGITGNWVNSCGCSTDCSCGPVCEVALPAPVVEVTEVNVAGTLITDFTVHGNRLVYTGSGDCPFPACQNMAAPVGDPDTFAVTYRQTYAPDAMGAYAAAVLAMEYANACVGNKCKLPAGVTQVVRQGVSIQIEGGAFPGGFTGIREVDTYIALWRPEGSPTRAPRVWAPGMGTRVER
jgi:hypothetical protein